MVRLCEGGCLIANVMGQCHDLLELLDGLQQGVHHSSMGPIRVTWLRQFICLLTYQIILLHSSKDQIFDMVQDNYAADSILKPFLQLIEPYIFPMDFDVEMILQRSTRHGLCSHVFLFPRSTQTFWLPGLVVGWSFIHVHPILHSDVKISLIFRCSKVAAKLTHDTVQPYRSIK